MTALVMRTDAEKPPLSDAQFSTTDELLHLLHGEQLLVVNKRRRNGLILYKGQYAEFAGPGAIVGGSFDASCFKVIPVGELSLVYPQSYEERREAYLTRRQWIRLTHQFTDRAVASNRAQLILTQFENYFDAETVAQLPDEAFARLVGVLPQTIRMSRIARNASRNRRI